MLPNTRPQAVLAAPASTVSRYEQTVDTTTLYNEGVAAHDTSGVVVLAFGQPWYQSGTYGAWNWSNRFFSIAQITSAVESWLSGWYVFTSNKSNYIRVAVGTSNDFGYTGSAHGQAWATMINNINAWIATPPSWLGSEGALAAIDVETEWSDPSASMQWASGYSSAYNCTNGCNFYYDFGDATGCPTSYTGTDSPCRGSWLQGHIQYMAWGAVPAYPLPEIYYPYMANQWEAISIDSAIFWGGAMFPVGSFTEYAADHSTNQPDQGWQQLQNAMDSNSSTWANLQFETDITWSN